MSIPRPARPNKRGIVIAVLIFLVVTAFASARFYTDVLWFKEIGFADVLWTSLRTQFFVGVAIGALTALIVWINLTVAARVSPSYRIPRVEIAGRPDPLEQYREVIGPYLKWIRLAGALVVGLLAGLGASTAWQTVLLYLNRTPFGANDPQFNKDIGFYVFELPFLDQVGSWLWFAIIASLFVSIATYYFNGAIRPEAGWRGVTSGALAHVSVLLGALALVKSFQYYLGTYQLNFSPRGVVTGASYTDVHAQLPALRLLALISIISALLFIVNIFVRKLSLPLAAVGIWILTAFLAGTVWPFAVQRFSVEPQEPQREGPFIARNLEATREAFGLGEVATENFAANSALDATGVMNNEEVLQNVRLWDPSVLQQAYSQLQAIRTYYQFTDVDIDRYVVDGQLRQVLLSARELSLSELPEPSWQNRHLRFTHGYGLVASLANESTTAGQPSFLVRDIPGTVAPGADALEPEEPRIYFGEGFEANEYSVVNSKQPELDFTAADGDVESFYQGEGGIQLGNLLRRVAFAVRERDPNLVLSGLIGGESRILIYRNVRERILRAAPFLSVDNDIYPAVVDGRMTWIADAYTTTPFYPYSQRFDASKFVDVAESGTLDGTINYVRNSVKVAVDAYNGDMKLYVVDEEDPLINAWREAFPSLFTSEEPSEELIEHFRYPEDMFKVQSEVFRTYHIEDAADFYDKEDEWDIPETPSVGAVSTVDGGIRIPPVYLLFKLPGETEQEFVLTRPFTPRGRSVMISSLLARSDPENYGELVSLEYPRSTTVLGPQQVENLINQDVEISQALTLLRSGGSTVQFGSLVILPIEESIMYIQPLFVTAENVGIPELKKVVVVIGEEVVMADNFDSALIELFDLDEEPDVSPTPSPSPDDGDEPVEPPEPETDLDTLVARAGRLYERAEAALEAGDFARYAELIERLGRVLQQAQDVSS